MQIRKAKFKDAKGIVEAHYDAIHNTAKADYDKEILKAWHSGVTKLRIERIKKVLNGTEEELFVYEDKGKIVGFASLVPDYNELRAIYVRSNYGNKAIGTKLLRALEARTAELKLPRLQLHSSLTAKRFYQKHGYAVLKKGIHTLSNGKKMDCIIMEKHFEPKPTTELVNSNSLKNCVDFLEARKETCLFLLGNLADYGFKLSSHANSGNYRLLKRGDKTVGVFSMTRRGNLLIQTDERDNYSHEIFEAIEKDNIQVKGIIGPWRDSFLFKIYYETVTPLFKANFVSKEWLYSLKLNTIKNTSRILEKVSVTFLTQKDFKQWDAFTRKSLEEKGLPTEENNVKKEQLFHEKIKEKH